MTKQQVSDKLIDLTWHSDVNTVIELLQRLKKEYPGYDSYYLDTDTEEYSDNRVFCVYGKRFETDIEYSERMKQNELWKEQRRQYYEKLKKEFE